MVKFNPFLNMMNRREHAWITLAGWLAGWPGWLAALAGCVGHLLSAADWELS